MRFIFSNACSLALSALLLCMTSVFGADPDVKEIIRQSTEHQSRNWKLASDYTFTETDVVTEKGEENRRTFKVLMLDGSPYNQIIAEDGHPLTPERQAAEQKKLQEEITRRNRESPSDRRRRIEAYRRSREQEHTMLGEMVNAFDFRLVGRAPMNGRDCYVLEATPRSGYEPTSNETKVLTGMRGKLWIDTRDYQWVKVQGEVVHAVTYGIFAKVSPGTRFELEQSPITPELWMPKHFSMKVNATVLGFYNENSTDDETYTKYQPNRAALAALTK